MTSDIAVYDGAQLDAYRPQIMTPDAARALDDQLRACTRAVLKDGTDFGTLPGTDGKNVLFKPGAEKLLQWFGLSYACERLDIEHDDEGRKEGVTYRATVLKRLPDGQLVTIAACDGYAGYDEDKFYQPAEVAQAKAEAKERHWAEKDRRVANPGKWKYITEYRAPWNTVIKMAQKRAIVGAVINATAAGGLFTVDDDSDQAPADGTPSWYQQALGWAATVTSAEEGRTLFRESAQAVISGTITPNQATHIQNRIKQRVKQLETHIQADVEDVTVATPEDASPVQAASPVAAEPPPDPPQAGAGEAPKKNGSTAGLIVQHFERLGVTDRNDRLILTAQVARLDDVPASTAKLTEAKQREVLKVVEKCRSLGDLRELLGTGEAPDVG